MGINTNPQVILQLWGTDPVHPMAIAYTKMAEKVLEEEVNVTGVMNSRWTASPLAARDTAIDTAQERDGLRRPPLLPTGWGTDSTAAVVAGTEAAAAAPEEPTGASEAAGGGNHCRGRWINSGNRRPN